MEHMGEEQLREIIARQGEQIDYLMKMLDRLKEKERRVKIWMLKQSCKCGAEKKVFLVAVGSKIYWSNEFGALVSRAESMGYYVQPVSKKTPSIRPGLEILPPIDRIEIPDVLCDLEETEGSNE